ncbi:hypothetical protein XELAEV_18034552mg [Xenopus laevis]|uniref:Uncharacterized protein n=1 Tax=Xenopus laevis TaxID=8355 RepID=A0A974CE70_XENLA|nr:hypothetical protein XELAEV_18034552mg [Xenopus laevis]
MTVMMIQAFKGICRSFHIQVLYPSGTYGRHPTPPDLAKVTGHAYVYGISHAEELGVLIHSGAALVFM